MKAVLHFIFVMSLSGLLFGCWGGGNSNHDVDGVENGIPVAEEQTLRTNQDSDLEIVLSGSDPDGDELTYSLVAAPGNGSVVGSGSELTYKPEQGFVGTDR